MTILLILLSSGAFGWAAYGLAADSLADLALFRQKIKLTSLLNSGKKTASSRTLVEFLENRSSFASQTKVLKKYFGLLSRLLQRANRSDFSHFTLLVGQTVLSLGGALGIGFLSGNLECAFLAFFAGGAWPVLWLRDQAVKRETALLRELPNALEILSLCSEAGLSLEQSMDQYLRHSKLGPLQEEFLGLLEQTKSGSSRKDALSAAARRLNLTDFTLFSTSLIQAERFGTGVAKTLRQLSLTMRDQQSQRAEKAVQEMPVKMLIPLILFIMPVTFLVIFSPVLLQFFKP